MSRRLLLLLLFISGAVSLRPYPIDGYERTGIRRLLQVQKVVNGEIAGTPPSPGALWSIDSISLNLTGERFDSTWSLPAVDPDLQKALNSLFPNLDESYAVALLDITPGRPVRYAQRKETRTFQPGSVGKLAVVTGFMCELEAIFPDSVSDRVHLLRTHQVKAGRWALPNEHTVPFYNPETGAFQKRVLQAGDMFSLYEWLDHMLSVSSNGAASVVWREAVLLRWFGSKYPEMTQVQVDSFFANTPKAHLSEIAMSVVNEPLRNMGIEDDEWRLGSFFTREAKAMIPGSGGSAASPEGMMKFMVAMERGQLIDPWTSLEVKRLMYMTDRRIRYAASPALKDAGVYFKSGSLYKCKPEEGYTCAKYKGNVDNYMNSVAIVEHPDSTTYLVALMSNVLRKNSNVDHNTLASQIDRIVRK
jgi:hypothetical protein